MNRKLQYLNLLGVVVLAGLCVFQWRANRKLNLEINQLEKSQQSTQSTLGEREKSLQASQADLEGFRKQLERLAETAHSAETNLTVTELRRQYLEDERLQFVKREDEWQTALNARDEQIKKANVELTELANSRNDAIKRFNELVEKYNALAKEITDLRAKPAP